MKKIPELDFIKTWLLFWIINKRPLQKLFGKIYFCNGLDRVNKIIITYKLLYIKLLSIKLLISKNYYYQKLLPYA